MVKCPECGFKARSSGGLKTHIRAKHGAKSLLNAAKSGDRRQLLGALLERLVDDFDGANARDKPGISRQIVQVSRELDSMPEGESRVDEIAKRRARRRAKAARR